MLAKTEEMAMAKKGGSRLVCPLCHQSCSLLDGDFGQCGVRQRQGHKVESLVYGRLVAANIDPVEKKPLFHVLPGSTTYSLATPGCNFSCLFCQNHSISQIQPERLGDAAIYSPLDVVESALASDCRSLCYTYVEPTVFLEYVLDCCLLARERGLANLFVSNGYMTDASLGRLVPLLSAINIDLKAFSDAFYRRFCGARLQPVLDNIKSFVQEGVWVEVTTLVIAGINDSDRELQDIADFLVSIDPCIPWHVTAFYPSYKMTSQPVTPAATLLRAREIGLGQGLLHVYTGNVSGIAGEDTHCPICHQAVLCRSGFTLYENRLVEGLCRECGASIGGVWK